MSSSDKDTKMAGESAEKTLTKGPSPGEEVAAKPDEKQLLFKTWDGKFVSEAHDTEYMQIALKAGDHSDLVKRVLRQRIEARAKDFPRWPADTLNGVRSVWIESRFWYDRERLSPDFDDDWRSYRARYLHSLELDPREPVHVPEYEIELINPIRRFYMIPGDWLENKIISKFAKDKYHSAVYRVTITRGLMIWASAIGIYYWLRYNSMNWSERMRPRLSTTRHVYYPGHPKYPFKDFRTEPTHHADYGFSRRTIYKDLRDWEDTTVVL